MGASFLDFNENIISSRAYKALPSRMKLLSNEQIPPYTHTTFSVTSVAEYLEVVNVISDSNREILTAPIYREEHKGKGGFSVARSRLSAMIRQKC